MRSYPTHEDLGLNPEADRTEDLRPARDDDPGAGTPRPSEPTLTKNQIGDSIMTQPLTTARDLAGEARIIVERHVRASSDARHTRLIQVSERLTSAINGLIAIIADEENGR